MKNLLKFLLSLLLLVNISCSTDTVAEATQSTTETVQVGRTVIKNLMYDSQDNAVNIDGQWHSNSNGSDTNWQYCQNYGFRWFEGFLYLHYNTNQFELVNAELVNFPYEYYLSTDGNGKFYIESPYFDQYYRTQGEIYYVKLTLKRI